MIKNYTTGGVNSFSQILLECSFENLCETLEDAIVSDNKQVFEQFGLVIGDQWKFIKAHGKAQAASWFKVISDETNQARELSKTNKAPKTSGN